MQSPPQEKQKEKGGRRGVVGVKKTWEPDTIIEVELQSWTLNPASGVGRQASSTHQKMPLIK